MVFLRSAAGDMGPTIQGRRVYLRYPQMSDYEAWSRLRDESRDFLRPWEPTWPADDLTRTAFRRRIRRYVQDIRDDVAYPFFVFRQADDALVGGMTFSHVRRGVTQSCSLGYWVGERHARQGFTSEAVSAALPFIFEHLRLHRLEAACLPTNAASIALLERVGFTREGYARRYLRINGLWQDHCLFAMLQDDPRPAPANRAALSFGRQADGMEW